MSGPPVSGEEDTIRALRQYSTLPPSTRAAARLRENLDGNWIATAQWDAQDLDAVAPKVALTESRWLVPALAGQTGPLTPLMLWWLLLFDLSIVARYEPALWSEALAVDRSPVAVPLEAVLKQAHGITAGTHLRTARACVNDGRFSESL